MGENAQQRPPDLGRPLSMRAIVLGGALVAAVGAVAVVALLYFYSGGTEQDQAGLDVIRTAGTLVVGTGGAIALLLAARRQRSTELTLEHQRLTLEHQREVAATAARDAVEQRITELYTRAVDQLGNDQAPVRLGGLHALERLAQDNPTQRQTIVDVICAYLRMPYTPPDDKPPADNVPTEAHTQYERRRQELQVRQTAQRILATHLKPNVADTFWSDIDLDLTEAHLHNFELFACHIRRVRFDGAQFSRHVTFYGAQFSGDAWFYGAQFSGDARFDEAQFSWDATFGEAQFSGDARFDGAQFSRKTRFERAQFSRDAMFSGAQFSGDATFDGAQFSGYATFDEAEFFGDATFGGTRFSNDAIFDGARTRSTEGHSSWPTSWTTREARDDEEGGWLYLVIGEDPH